MHRMCTVCLVCRGPCGCVSREVYLAPSRALSFLDCCLYYVSLFMYFRFVRAFGPDLFVRDVWSLLWCHSGTADPFVLQETLRFCFVLASFLLRSCFVLASFVNEAFVRRSFCERSPLHPKWVVKGHASFQGSLSFCQRSPAIGGGPS
jgi:hypothetical protein